MKVVILAGGYGTRLSEETDVLPKPMIEIGGKPLLWHLMKIFSTQGFNEFVIALGYKSQVIKRYFLDYPQLESDLHIELVAPSVAAVRQSTEAWKIDLVDTGHDTMTGGRLKRLQKHIGDTFFFTYGDGLANIDLHALLAFHRQHGRLATVTAVQPPSRFGVLQLNGDRVGSFHEKPMQEDQWISGGFFVLEPEAIDKIGGDETIWERDTCQRLAHENNLHAYRHRGYWQCVDTLHELRLLRDAWGSGKAQWKIWT
jgi:glucose-1-phosphate cytidylyltransferase